MQGKISLQESFNTDSKYRSFSWKILRQAMEVFGAKTYVGETALTEGQFNESNVVHWNAADQSPQKGSATPAGWDRVRGCVFE